MAAAVPATSPVSATTPARTIGSGTLLHILWRSFFFQAATNYQRMQNVGFAYCILPALTRLYEGEALRRAMARHLEFFNSHPYMADALIGATVRMEMEIAAGRRSPESVSTFKSCMMGPMAAIGDSFFWASLKPFAATFAVAGVLSDITWAPLVFLVLYNLFHLGLRIYGLWAGFRQGERVFEQLYRVDLVRFSDRSHYLAGVCIGAAATLTAYQAARTPVDLGHGLEPIFLLAITLICFLSIKRKIPMPFLLYAIATICVGLILGLNAAYPLL